MESPSFLIPIGTHVVLRSGKRVPGSRTTKPAGSVAEVIESPPNNERSYRIRFVDGVELRVKFGELASRRREMRD